jgi:hypothetical protein
MKSLSPRFLLLLASVSLMGAVATALASESVAEDDEGLAGVARLYFVDGDVSFLRRGDSDWAPAVQNLPLLAGDRLSTASGARAEIQLAHGSYIRMAENTVLTISELSETAARFLLTEGTLIIRVDHLAPTLKQFEVDTPQVVLALAQGGLYRISARSDGESRIVVRRGGAEVTTADGSFKLREGYHLLTAAANGQLEIAADNLLDDWDHWSYERDAEIDRLAVPEYVVRYETTFQSFFGSCDLVNYGWWTTLPSYGYCWVPRVSAGWAPYRYGQWIWIPLVGWTWLAREPWGWAPYHYGRWACVSGIGWVWVPGIGTHYSYGYSYYRWRPALVSFFYFPTRSGNYIGWCPLRPGQHWRKPDSLASGARSEKHKWYSTHKDAITVIPADDFARKMTKAIHNLPSALTRARPGLPEIHPGHEAVAPVVERSERGLGRVIPSLQTEPVVNGNLGAASEQVEARPRKRDRGIQLEQFQNPEKKVRLAQPALEPPSDGIKQKRREQNQDQSGEAGKRPCRACAQTVPVKAERVRHLGSVQDVDLRVQPRHQHTDASLMSAAGGFQNRDLEAAAKHRSDASLVKASKPRHQHH